MQMFLVCVAHERSSAAEVNVEGLERSVIFYHPEHVKESEVPHPYEGEHFWRNVRQLQCATEAHAERAARSIARYQPGAKVLLSKVYAQVVAPITEPVVQTITEKGVLPA